MIKQGGIVEKRGTADFSQLQGNVPIAIKEKNTFKINNCQYGFIWIGIIDQGHMVNPNPIATHAK